MQKISMILVLSILLSENLYSQNDCEITTREDQFENKKIHELFLTIADGYYKKATLFAQRKGNDVYIIFSIEQKLSVTCFKKDAKAIFLFTDKSKGTLINTDDLNCNGDFTAMSNYSKNTKKTTSPSINTLLSKKIKAIRFYSSDGYFDIDIAEDVADKIQLNLACLMKAL
jgi:hypothetical protein